MDNSLSPINILQKWAMLHIRRIIYNYIAHHCTSEIDRVTYPEL